MKLFFGTAFLFLFLSLAIIGSQLYQIATSREAQRAAVFTNDLELVEFNPTDPADEDSDTADDVPVGSNSEEFQNSPPPPPPADDTDPPDVPSDPEGENTDTDTPPPPPQSSDPVVEEVEVSDTPPNDEGGSGGGDTEVVDAENVYATLIGNQAVVNSTGGSGGIFDFANGDSSIRIDADKVRDSLAARDIRSISVRNRNALLAQGSRAVFSESDFAIFVSSAILSDDNVSDVTYEDGVVITKYRPLGRLFAVIPVRYTLRVEITIDDNAVSRVNVKFPWYKFFLATGISERGLESLLAQQIEAYGGTDTSTEIDVATRAFSAVADVLRTRLGI